MQAERSHFVFLPWGARGSLDSPLGKLHVSVFSLRARPLFRFFSPAVPDAAGIDGDYLSGLRPEEMSIMLI